MVRNVVRECGEATSNKITKHGVPITRIVLRSQRVAERTNAVEYQCLTKPGSKMKLQPFIAKHRLSCRHPWRVFMRNTHRKNKRMHKHMVSNAVHEHSKVKQKLVIIAYQPHSYCYVCNVSQHAQTLRKDSVKEKSTKLMFCSFESNKHFTRTTLACHQLLSNKIFPWNCDIQFRLFLITPVAVIRQRVRILCLSLETESEVSLSFLRKYDKKT